MVTQGVKVWDGHLSKFKDLLLLLFNSTIIRRGIWISVLLIKKSRLYHLITKTFDKEYNFKLEVKWSIWLKGVFSFFSNKITKQL